MKSEGFPFSAAEGLDAVRRALLLAAVNPECGGVLVSGKSGTGKSTVVRGIREIAGVPWTEAPVSVTEDRLFGAADAESAVREGKLRLRAGVLQSADGGILYIDDVNLLRRELLLPLLDAGINGGYMLERDGFSQYVRTDFTVLAVMNPDEGTLSSSALDRFGLFAEAESLTEPAVRAALLRKIWDFERDPRAFREKWESEIVGLRDKLNEARSRLPEVEISEAMLRLVAVYASKAFCAGERAGIFLAETARAAAAWDGRAYVLPRDIEEAAQFVLPHRMRQPPEEERSEPAGSDDAERKGTREAETEREGSGRDDPEREMGHGGNEPSRESGENSTEEKEEQNSSRSVEERIDATDERVCLPRVWIAPPNDRRKRKGSGKRNFARADTKQGRYVRAEVPKGKVTDLALDATLRAAAPYQKSRRDERGGNAISIRKEDLRNKVREKRTGTIFLFCVDASGSMGVRERMKAVKGVILNLLLDAYQKRDKVGMIVFRRKKAEVLLPVTRSAELAKKCLSALPTGGKTPLAEGLTMAERTIAGLRRQDSSAEPVLILITDGRATGADGGSASGAALEAARRLRKQEIAGVVIDTEHGFVRVGIAAAIAREMRANYYPMDRLSSERLLRIARLSVGSRQ